MGRVGKYREDVHLVSRRFMHVAEQRLTDTAAIHGLLLVSISLAINLPSKTPSETLHFLGL